MPKHLWASSKVSNVPHAFNHRASISLCGGVHWDDCEELPKAPDEGYCKNCYRSVGKKKIVHKYCLTLDCKGNFKLVGLAKTPLKITEDPDEMFEYLVVNDITEWETDPVVHQRPPEWGVFEDDVARLNNMVDGWLLGRRELLKRGLLHCARCSNT